MEEYLIEQYNVFEDTNYLTNESEIEEYFKEVSMGFFECGQGYFQDEAEIICKIDNRFFEVSLDAEIGSSKQDRGDRLYWVESVEKVTYKEIAKPLRKEVASVEYVVKVTTDQQALLEAYMDEYSIEITYRGRR